MLIITLLMGQSYSPGMALNTVMLIFEPTEQWGVPDAMRFLGHLQRF